MDKEGKLFGFGLIIIAVFLGYFFPLDSYAQTIISTDGLGRGVANIKDDVKSYEIIYKEYGKVYEDYYQAVRQRIVQKLQHNYRDYYRDGDVNLFFVLKSNGSLVRIDVDTGKSTDDKKLIGIAIASLQGASPFIPFPKELDAAELPFSLTISFKENN